MKIIDMTAVELGAAIKNREITVKEGVEAALGQIREKEEAYHCYVTIDEEGALKQAQQVQQKIDAGELAGALAGVPAAIKDNLCTEGLLTTCSSKILYDFVPAFSAEAVLNLRRAGAVILGKTNMTSLPWVPPQRPRPLAQPRIHGIQGMCREALPAAVRRQWRRRNASMPWAPIREVLSASRPLSVGW